jgi:hypothetical protein
LTSFHLRGWFKQNLSFIPWLRDLVKINIGSHGLGKMMMELKNLRILVAGNLSRSSPPPWITKLRVLNAASSWKLEIDFITHVTDLKFLSVQGMADFGNLTKLTWLETLHVSEKNFPDDVDLQNLVNLKALKFLPPPVDDITWPIWLKQEAEK